MFSINAIGDHQRPADAKSFRQRIDLLTIIVVRIINYCRSPPDGKRPAE